MEIAMLLVFVGIALGGLAWAFHVFADMTESISALNSRIADLYREQSETNRRITALSQIIAGPRTGER